MTLLTLLGWLLALFWLVHAGIIIHFLTQHRLTGQAANLPKLTQPPRLSIIVPARDEATAIRDALSSLLNLDYANYEVIAIDDRSCDATGSIMDELAAKSPHLKVLHIETLPEGWLGKTHAMHLAAEQATGEYLIFTDGDVVYQAQALTPIMQLVTAQNLDHLALLPRLLAGDYAENSVTQFMGLIFILSLYPFRISNPKSRFYAGVGPFNLIRRSCYQAIGGFAKLRLEVVEDMALGREVKVHGFKSQLLLADALLQFRWQREIKGLIRGIEKNSFAAIDYSPLRLIYVTLLFALLLLLPYWAIIALPFSAALGYSLAFVTFHALFAYWGEKAQVGWQINFALLFAVAITLWALWRSAFLTIKQDGIYWRDTFYPLALLKSKNRF